jgi:protein ImuB
MQRTDLPCPSLRHEQHDAAAGPRIATVVFAELASELGRVVLAELASERAASSAPTSAKRAPLGVLVVDPADRLASASDVPGHALLDAACREARRAGVRAGHTVAEAAALASSLQVVRLERARIEGALARLAEGLAGFGRTVAIRLASEAGSTAEARATGPWDAVWIDTTGAAHLFGGEEELAEAIRAKAQSLGHHARVVLSSGPRAGLALGRGLAEGAARTLVVPPGGVARALAGLPVVRLPVARDVTSYLVRLGVLTVGDLAALPVGTVLARMHDGSAPSQADARVACALASGLDPTPLLALAPTREVTEEAFFEDGVEHAGALLFSLSALVSRAVERLQHRGESTSLVRLEAPYDAGIARARAAELGLPAAPRDLSFELALASPVSRRDELFRALQLRLEPVQLFAPARALRLTFASLSPAAHPQLDLGRDASLDESRLPALLAELSAELGRERVGRLELVDTHRIEARSHLARVERLEPSRRRGRANSPPELLTASSVEPEGTWITEPTRVFVHPLPLGMVPWLAVRHGAEPRVELPWGVFRIIGARFWMRQEDVEWWTEAPLSRDYYRARLALETSPSMNPMNGGGEKSLVEGLVFVARGTGESFLQGLWE